MEDSLQATLSRVNRDDDALIITFDFPPFSVMRATAEVQEEGIEIRLYAKTQAGKTNAVQKRPDSTRQFFVTFEGDTSAFGILDVFISQTGLTVGTYTRPREVDMDIYDDNVVAYGRNLIEESVTSELGIFETNSETNTETGVQPIDSPSYEPDGKTALFSGSLSLVQHSISELLPDSLRSKYANAGISTSINTESDLDYSYYESPNEETIESGTGVLETPVTNSAEKGWISEVWSVVDTTEDSLEVRYRLSSVRKRRVKRDFKRASKNLSQDVIESKEFAEETSMLGDSVRSYRTRFRRNGWRRYSPPFALNPTQSVTTVDFESGECTVIIPRGESDKSGRYVTCYEWKRLADG